MWLCTANSTSREFLVKTNPPTLARAAFALVAMSIMSGVLAIVAAFLLSILLPDLLDQRHLLASAVLWIAASAPFTGIISGIVLHRWSTLLSAASSAASYLGILLPNLLNAQHRARVVAVPGSPHSFTTSYPPSPQPMLEFGGLLLAMATAYLSTRLVARYRRGRVQGAT